MLDRLILTRLPLICLHILQRQHLYSALQICSKSVNRFEETEHFNIKLNLFAKRGDLDLWLLLMQ